MRIHFSESKTQCSPPLSQTPPLFRLASTHLSPATPRGHHQHILSVPQDGVIKENAEEDKGQGDQLLALVGGGKLITDATLKKKEGRYRRWKVRG